MPSPSGAHSDHNFRFLAAPVHSKHAAASGDSLAVEKKRRKAKDKDEVLSEDSDGGAAQPSGDESSEDDGETAQEKRLRLAKAFIAKLEDEGDICAFTKCMAC